MNRIKRMTLGFMTAFFLSAAIPVFMPLDNNLVQAADVKLNFANTDLNIGDTVQLKILGTPKTVKWTSSDEKIAKVSSKGLVTGIKKGTVKISAVLDSKKFISTVKVLPKELAAEEVYDKCSKATVEIVAQVAGDKYNLGSGFFIDTGKVVTNFHVVGGADRIQIMTSDKQAYEVRQVLGYDEKIDLAILKVDTKNESLPENDKGIKPGETIYVLGSPLGLTGTFADGMVSSVSRKIDDVDYIQVTAPMSPGNSGGPLLNKYGEVIGINTWQYTDGQNLNFSINIDEISNINTKNPLSMDEFYLLTEGYSSEEAGDTAYAAETGKNEKDGNLTDIVADLIKSSSFYHGFLRFSDSDITDYTMLFFQ